MKYLISKLEPETLVLWISRSMLGLLFLLICRLIKLMSKISTIRVSFAETEQPIRSRKLCAKTIYKLSHTLIGLIRKKMSQWISRFGNHGKRYSKQRFPVLYIKLSLFQAAIVGPGPETLPVCVQCLGIHYNCITPFLQSFSFSKMSYTISSKNTKITYNKM